jgi:16S rRNA (adenine1518-N6/adenine1519-N6)-dimethyltransferase
MRPKKSLGQHFLTAPSYAKRIAESVPARTDENILEIGPGQGALSIFIKERFPRFHLIEIDKEAIERLKQKLGGGCYTVHAGDVRTFDFGKVGFPLHSVGNLPYSIGALIIKKTLLYGNAIVSFTFMVQKEVAQRIVSGPHRRTNGFLSIFCQFFGAPKILFHVPPGAFFPRPNVDSSVVQLVVDANLSDKIPREEWEIFFSFVDKGFSMRRKQLAKVLGYDEGGAKYRYQEMFEELGMSPGIRPEDLDINGWLHLYKRVRKATWAHF